MPTTTVKLATATLAAGLVLAACGSDDDGTTPAVTVDAEAGTSQGTIFVSGSSTVEPISSLVADEFNLAGSPASITVEGPGTGDGFEIFCAGESEIADASRPISEEEVAACEAAGIGFIELEIALDGITVLTSAKNDAVECLSFADMYALVGPESQGFSRWSDGQAIAEALGSTAELPDAELAVTAPGSESGTYDTFVELVLGGPSEARLASGDITEDEVETSRTDYSSQADDNAIIAGIEGSDTSFGWVGFAFAEGAGDTVKEIAVAAEPGGACVPPTAETIADGTYPISRSLYIYVDAAKADEHPALAEYVDFYLEAMGNAELVAETGYVALPPDRLDATRSRWETRTTGTAAGG